MASEQDIYKLESITKSYGDRVALAIRELSFLQGQTCALVGPNGSGKTTLLRLLSLIDRPTSGRIFFHSTPLWNGSAQIELARRVTMVAHPPYLFNRSVAYNVSYGMRIRGTPRGRIREKIKEVLAIAGLAGFEKREARKLSSGEQQRVALARALALEPEVLLLDEPTASVDRKHSREIESFIKKLDSQKSMTIIFSTHDHQQAHSLARRIIPLYEGKVESFAYENFFAGTGVAREGKSSVHLNNKVSLEIAAPADGPIHVSIDPLDIVVSRNIPQSPRSNRFRGKLVAMALQESAVKLTIDIGVPLACAITRDSLMRLSPKLGEELYCLFEASAVRIIENGKTT